MCLINIEIILIRKKREIEEKTNLINKKIFDETACSEKGIKF